MGYESRIIVARKCTCKMKNEAGEVYDDFFTVKLADMWLSRMPRDFVSIFTNPVTWKIYGDGFEINSESEYDMTEDCYGAICQYADVQTVVDYLEKAEAEEHYRRFTPAIAMLKAYAAEDWDDPLIVIHYGY